jgi:hypothetical protein
MVSSSQRRTLGDSLRSDAALPARISAASTDHRSHHADSARCWQRFVAGTL